MTNIFSTYFKLETVDRSISQLKYVQVFRDNMKTRGKPKDPSLRVEPYTKKLRGYLIFTFGLDLYTDQMYQLLERRI